MEMLLHPPDTRIGTGPIRAVPALRARVREVYGIDGARLRDLVALLRQVPRDR